MVSAIKQTLERLNSNCFICLKPLGKAFNKMRTCGAEICLFRFEEIEVGNIFLEIKKDPTLAHFLIESSYMAYVSSRAADITEPFPPFMLKQK